MASRATAWAALLLFAACAATAAGLHVARDGEPGLEFVNKRGGSCHKGRVRKTTLKTIKEAPFAGLFPDLRNSTVFEASAVTRVRGKFYVVFDNAMSVGYLDSRFQFRDPENKLVGAWEPESQFEGIAYVPEDDTFLLLHESAQDAEAGGTFKPVIRHVKLAKDHSDYEVLKVCPVDFELEEENKGFESIQYLHTPSGPVLLGMCEGNHCAGGARGRDPGNGRIIVSQLKESSDGDCVWEPFKTIEVPPSASFADYAGMAYNYETQKLAILSQEESAIWVGDFNGDELEFASQEGITLYLPRDGHCQVVYCNAEGISWIDHYRIVIASDKAKSNQPFWCDAKDQSIHLFAMPRAWDPYSPAAAMAAALEAEEAREL